VWVVVHTYVGLAVAATLPLPYWQLVLIVVASHILLDLVPHWDYTVDDRFVLWGWLDFLAALATCLALLFLGGWSLPLVLLGPISGAPDFDVLVRALRGRRGRAWFPSHWERFPHGRCGPRTGIALQAALMTVSAALFLG
jgi:hypothetical protein